MMWRTTARLAASAAFVVIWTIVAIPAGNAQTDPQFESVAGEVAQMRALFSGGNGQPVSFNADLARQQLFSTEAIDLAGELTAFTNELMAAAADALKALAPADPAGPEPVVDIRQLNVDVSAHPKMAAFFQQAHAYRRAWEALPDSEKKARAQAIGGAQPHINPWDPAALLCGYYTNPMPSVAKAYVFFNNVANPAGTLQAWGYHADPLAIKIGAGWTRPQTFRWWICGFSTFRDNAVINGHTISEQNYAGWTPNGEPNPEVWRVGPWPYETWPAYVYWWHQTH